MFVSLRLCLRKRATDRGDEHTQPPEQCIHLMWYPAPPFFIRGCMQAHVFEYLCKYHVFVALGALDSLLSQNEIYVRTRYQPIPAQRRCLKGFMSTMPRTKCMKCIIKKKLSKCHAFTMDISPSLGATELFTLAEEYHYDDHSCHTCIFPPQ